MASQMQIAQGRTRVDIRREGHLRRAPYSAQEECSTMRVGKPRKRSRADVSAFVRGCIIDRILAYRFISKFQSSLQNKANDQSKKSSQNDAAKSQKSSKSNSSSSSKYFSLRVQRRNELQQGPSWSLPPIDAASPLSGPPDHRAPLTRPVRQRARCSREQSAGSLAPPGFPDLWSLHILPGHLSSENAGTSGGFSFPRR